MFFALNLFDITCLQDMTLICCMSIVSTNKDLQLSLTVVSMGWNFRPTRRES